MIHRRLRDHVMEHGTGVIKAAIDPAKIIAMRERIFEWGLKAPQSSSTHRIDNNPPNSSTPHIFHAFWVNELTKHPLDRPFAPHVYDDLESISDKIITLQPNFIRQAIQYPRGGGFFAEHDHDLDPQRIGLILMASQVGKDFNSGNVRFKINGEWREVPLDLGDICLFRHDLPHDITPVDPDVPLDWSRADGRWTFVLSIPGAR